LVNKFKCEGSKEAQNRRHVVSASLPSREYFLSAIGFVIVGFIVGVIVLIAPAFCLERAAADSEAQDEPDEGNSTEDTKCKCLSLGLDLGCQREETPRQEWANRTASGAEGLREAVKSAQDCVIRGGIGNLE
jgi:hypothetical protein